MDDNTVVVWNRCDVAQCGCSDLSFTHVHCLCNLCQGKAVSKSTEWRHWTAAKQDLELRCHSIRDRSPQGRPSAAAPNHEVTATIATTREPVVQDEVTDDDHESASSEAVCENSTGGGMHGY